MYVYLPTKYYKELKSLIAIKRDLLTFIKGDDIDSGNAELLFLSAFFSLNILINKQQ